MKKVLFFLVFTSLSFAQIDHVEPPFWWSGMNCSKIQILFHGKNLQDYSITSTDIPILNNTHYGYNKDYCFVEINTRNIEPKDVVFTFTNYSNKNDTFTYKYSIKKRIENSGNRKGFDSKDVLYLIMPDRFSNGNPNNDSTTDTQEKANRTLPGGRHGGDIQGIINHLDYIQELVATALWCTPLCEDNVRLLLSGPRRDRIERAYRRSLRGAGCSGLRPFRGRLMRANRGLPLLSSCLVQRRAGPDSPQLSNSRCGRRLRRQGWFRRQGRLDAGQWWCGRRRRRCW